MVKKSTKKVAVPSTSSTPSRHRRSVQPKTPTKTPAKTPAKQQGGKTKQRAIRKPSTPSPQPSDDDGSISNASKNSSLDFLTRPLPPRDTSDEEDEEEEVEEEEGEEGKKCFFSNVN